MTIKTMPEMVRDILSRLQLLERRLGSGRSGTGTPIGAVLPFAGTVAPSGYLLATGGTQLIANFPQLFAVLGTTYGGNGTTTFGIPDLRGRTPVGRNPGDTAFGTLGAAVGTQTHTLTTAEMPSHTHAPSGVDNLFFQGIDGSTLQRRIINNPASGGTALWTFTTAAATDLQYGAATAAAGSGGAHNNIQPSRVLDFIIKT